MFPSPEQATPAHEALCRHTPWSTTSTSPVSRCTGRDSDCIDGDNGGWFRNTTAGSNFFRTGAWNTGRHDTGFT